MLRKIFISATVLTLIMTAVTYSVNAQQSALQGPKGGLIADVKAHKIGDIVTILINEDAQATNVTNTQTSKESSLDMNGDFGNNFLKALTGSISAGTSTEYNGNGTVSSRGQLSVTLTATIVGVREDGNFLIRGTREVNTNGEKVVTVAEGVVRPADITNNNTISASLIADAKIFHQGKGIATEARRPGIIQRLLNWIF
ncbi:MAG: flagellar basal body L-ring protein FlgH [bacterium]|nr:flagellar basal body L-ring protein FlgH [bacterium]